MSYEHELQPGIYENVRIIRHGTRIVGAKKTPLLEIICEAERVEFTVNVWLSEKSLGMARRALKLVGFDIDVHELSRLAREPTLLAGRIIPAVDVENGNYGTTGSICLDQNIDAAGLDELTRALRAVKKPNEPEPPVPQSVPDVAASVPHAPLPRRSPLDDMPEADSIPF